MKLVKEELYWGAWRQIYEQILHSFFELNAIYSIRSILKDQVSAQVWSRVYAFVLRSLERNQPRRRQYQVKPPIFSWEL